MTNLPCQTLKYLLKYPAQMSVVWNVLRTKGVRSSLANGTNNKYLRSHQKHSIKCLRGEEDMLVVVEANSKLSDAQIGIK